MSDDHDERAVLRRWPVAISERKWRLFACACCRNWWEDIYDERSQRAVDVAEQFADGLCGEDERAEASAQAGEVLPGFRTGSGWQGVEHAHRCLMSELGPLMLWDTPQWGVWRWFPRVIIDEIFGQPRSVVTFDRHWRTSDTRSLAEGIYTERAFDRMPILADALEDAGCDDRRILDHCRNDGTHYHGCWAVDLVLGKV